MAARDITGAGFILTIPDAEAISVVVIVEGEVRVIRLLLLPVVCRNRCLIIHQGKVSEIMSLIS